MRTAILLMVAILLTGCRASAQSSIDAIAQKLIQNPGKNEVYYNEQRDPGTKKVKESSLMVRIADNGLAERLEKAFKKEQENAVTVDYMSKTQCHVLTFIDSEGMESQYTLIIKPSRKQFMVNKHGKSYIKSSVSSGGGSSRSKKKSSKSKSISTTNNRILVIEDGEIIFGND